MKKRFVDKSADIQHFSLRKLSIGVASVLIGTTFMMYGGKTVHAAEENPNNNSDSNTNNTSESVDTKENTVALKNNYTTQSQVERDQKNPDDSAVNDANSSISLNNAQDQNYKDTSKLEINDNQLSNKDNGSTVKSELQVSENKASYATNSAQKSNANKSNSQQEVSQHTQANKSDTNDGITNHGVDPSQIATLKKAALKAMGMDTDLTDEQLAKLGLDRDTFLHNGIKYKVKANIDVHLREDLSKYFSWSQDPRHDANGDAHDSSVDISKEDDNTAAAMQAGIGRIVFNQLWAPYVNGGTIYINRGSKLSDKDAFRSVSNSQFAGGFESVVWDNQIANQVDINKVGTYNAAVDVMYKNKLGVSAGVKVIVVDPQGKTVYVTKNDPVDSASDDLISTSVPSGSTNIVWQSVPSTSTVGTQTGIISVTYPDNTTGQAKVTYIVSDPQGQDLVVVPGYEPKPGEIISNSSSMPAGTTYRWKTTAPDTKVPGSTVPAIVTVTYPDGHSHDVLGGVRVISATGKPAITVHVNDPVPDAKTIITNTSDLPANTTYTWKTQPDTSKAGTVPATVEVTYPTGVVQEVPTNVIVIGNNDNNPATVTIKDHSKEVIRVIVDNVPGQAQPTVTWQTVHYSRDVTYDTKTGAATKYGDWQADDTPTWAAYTAKGAKGYTPSITVVPAQNVTPDTQNTVVSITYTLNSQPTSPSNPSNPTSPTSPTTPTTPVNPTSPSNPTSPTSPTNPTTPVNPTSPSNPTNPTSPTSPTNPVQPTTAPVHPENPVNPTQPNNNNNGGNNSNSGNNGNQGNGNNTSGNVAPHATVTPKNGNGGSGTNENVAPGNGNTVNNINKHGSENVAPHAQSLANINGNGTNSNNLPKSNSNGNQNQLPQTGQSTKEEAMAAAGLMIAVGDGIFVMAGTQKRRRRN